MCVCICMYIAVSFFWDGFPQDFLHFWGFQWLPFLDGPVDAGWWFHPREICGNL